MCELAIPKVNRKRLVSTLMSGHSSTANEGQAFLLKSTREFASRSNQVFDELKKFEEQHETWQAQQDEIPDLKESGAGSDIQEGTVEIFKKPFARISRKRKSNSIPDFMKNPEKWKKYSLADTPDLSDESNTATALQFIQDLKLKRQKLDDTNDELLFQKPLVTSSNVEPDTVKNMGHSSTSTKIMPEYVVGEKNLKRAKKEQVKLVQNHNITLHHLEDSFEEES